jgi:hypothetical protein
MKLSKELSAGTLHPRENLVGTGTLGTVNAEVVVDSHGCSAVALDLRGTFSLTMEVSGTVDGNNWILIPIRSQLGGAWLAAVVGTTSGVWMANCVGFTKVRARVTAYTSGGAITTLSASTALFDDFAKNGNNTTNIVTAVGAAGAAVTLTLPAPGAGLRQYLTYLRIAKYATALLTASATPVTITTTNIPGTPAFTFPADAAAQGSVFSYQEDFAYPVMANAQNTALTVVCPATTAVLWRVTGGYYIAP